MAVHGKHAKPDLQPHACRAKLSMTEKLGYASGDFASCLYFGIFMNFLSYFYTDIFGISAAAFGTMILVVRIWDWIKDPIMGVIADHTRTKMGRFRPWILWMIGPFAITGVLAFTTFDLEAPWKLVYAYCSYTLLAMVYTAINIPYSALMGVMTSNSEERTVLSSFRFIGSAAGNLVVSASLLYLVALLGQGNPQRGFTLTVAVYAVLASGLFLFTFLATRERVEPPSSQNFSIKSDIRALLKNTPWIIMIFVSLLTIIGFALRGGATIYYFKYLAGNELFASQIFTISAAVQIVAVLLTKRITIFFGGKKRAFFWLSIASAGLYFVFYFFDSHNQPLILAHQVAMTLVAAPLMPLFWSMIADTADYGAWKFGHRSTGLLFSAGTFSQKIGWSIGPALASWLLAYYGFVANVDQNSETLHAMRLMMSVFPAVSTLFAVGVLFLYSIDGKMEKQLADHQQTNEEGSPCAEV
jgi:GPH family glycoside/pentoside/hexuronide:cation symporter